MTPASIVNGVPVAPDVEKLMRQLHNLKAGHKVSYGQITRIIGTDAQSMRGRSVVVAWRKRLERESNIVLRCIAGYGYEVCDGMARVSVSTSRFKSGMRHVTRAARIAATTDRLELTPDAAKAADHVTRIAAVLSQAHNVAPRSINFQQALKQVAG